MSEELLVIEEISELVVEGAQELVVVEQTLELLEVAQQGPRGVQGVPGTGAEDVAVLSWLGV
jgi:hypothetical protein